MPHYYFDIREGGELLPDEEGLTLASLRSAQEEAARSLGDFARDTASQVADGPSEITIEVRDQNGPVMQLKFSFEMLRH